MRWRYPKQRILRFETLMTAVAGSGGEYGLSSILAPAYPARLASPLQETSGKALDSCLIPVKPGNWIEIPLMINKWRVANGE